MTPTAAALIESSVTLIGSALVAMAAVLAVGLLALRGLR